MVFTSENSNFGMGVINAIRQIYLAINPPIPALSEAAKGLCVLPPPVKMAKVAQKPRTDAFIISEDTNTWGFNETSAHRHFEGSTDSLTAYDVHCLKDRGQWPKSKANQNTRGRMKSLWHSGATIKEIGAATGMSESLVEKIIAAFPAALEMEKMDSGATLPENGGECA